MRLSAPRAARSHSTSVGSRCPAHSQYVTASDYVTLTTGSFSVPFGNFPGQWGASDVPSQKGSASTRGWLQNVRPFGLHTQALAPRTLPRSKNDPDQ